MKTVPTLCATATVVGASAVGLSFGRPEHSLDPTNKNKPTQAKLLEDSPMSSAVQASSSTPAAFSYSSPLPLSTTSSRIAPPRSHDGRPAQRRIVRRMTSGDAVPPVHEDVNDGPVPSNRYDLDDIDPASTLRPRSSWLKRLSAVSIPSRDSSPGPVSPSVSASNGSMAFSHDGSTAPMVGKRSPSPLPPNKLVKRSSSVRTQHDSPVQTSSSRLPTFRRPATSHQRSATLQYHTTLTEMPVEESFSFDESRLPSSIHQDVPYTRYFNAKISKDNTLSKKRSSSKPNALKRVFPHENYTPTLLLAKSVSAAGSVELDESSSQDGDSVYFVTRPSTPLDMASNFTSNIRSLREHTDPTPGKMAEMARPRRSFSISDFLSGSKKERPTMTSSTKLTRKSSKRISSAPLLAMGIRQSVTAHGESERPPARRDLTDPTHFRREIYSSPNEAQSISTDGAQAHTPAIPIPSLPQRHANDTGDAIHTSSRPKYFRPSASGRPNQASSSPNLPSAGGRPSRLSVAPSEQASTLIGSDNEARGVGSGDEDDADLQSDTLFDSLRTGATRSSAGARGPRIETIFDESPPQASKTKVTALRDLLPRGTFREPPSDSTAGNHSIAEEEESISTPVRTIVPERLGSESPTTSRANGNALFPSLIPSSPPDMPKPLNLGTLEWDNMAEEDDDSKWSLDEEEEEEAWDNGIDDLPATHVATPVSIGRHNPRLLNSSSVQRPLISQHFHSDHIDRDARSSIFDWSEQQPNDKSSGNRSPPRPSTVHGKKDTDGRGSRSVGRRAPSALHARSQSVPVVPDVAGKRSTVVTNKFGTWGVGSKGVSEDWNDDFDFSDSTDAPTGPGEVHAQRADSGLAMIVPKTIQEQQNNVLANIGLLREWGLLIEELKEQRIRAVALGLLEGPNAGMWEEVDAMIDLADQEAAEEGVPRLSPPSSPGFDAEAFDDVSGPSPNNDRGGRQSSGLASDAPPNTPTQPVSQSSRPRRRSILPANNDIFGPQSSPIPSTTRHFSSSKINAPTTRPRKDSEAKARSVIEALQKRKSTHEPLADVPSAPATKKVPFDTATLRRIVPYVNTLTRKIKDALRDAEGLYSSPSTSPKEPPFSKIFQTEQKIRT